MESDPRRNPDNLRTYLSGIPGLERRGLIRRVENRVQDLARFRGLPVGSGGSPKGTFTTGGKGDTDPLGSVFELSEFLVEWLDGGATGIGSVVILLDAAHDQTRGELMSPLPDVDRVLRLTDFLIGWLESGCAHAFRPIEKLDDGYLIRCVHKNCKLQIEPPLSNQVPLGVCERCGTPLTRNIKGPDARFCSVRCRVAAWRESA